LKRLWQAVLYQAVDDALNGVAYGTKNQKRNDIIEARELLTNPSRDLDMICAGAGLEPDAVIERMTKLIAKAPPVEVLMQGKAARASAERQKREQEKKAAKTQKTPVLYTYNGESLTLTEWSERTGLSVQLIRGRINSGWAFEDAVTTTKKEAALHARQAQSEAIKASLPSKETGARGTPARMITHNGETLSLTEWSKRLGVSKQTIRNRIAKGLTIEGR